MLRSCQIHGGSYNFTRILIFACKLKFYHWQQIVFLLWSDRLTSLLKKISAKFPSLNNHSLSVSCSNKTSILQNNNKASAPCKSNSDTTTVPHFDKQQRCFMHTSYFFTQNIKETCIQGLNFNKHGHSSVKLALLFLSSFLVQANAWLWIIHVPAVLHTIFDFGFGTISANVNPVKRPNNILVLLWKLFWPCGTPERVSGTPSMGL